MSATLNGFGLRPTYHPSGLSRPTAYPAAFSAAYATSLYQGTPVALDTNGNIIIAVQGANDYIGAFDGVEYTDSNGRRQYVKQWVASTANVTDVVAYVWDDPTCVYEIQADGSLAQTSIGDQANFSTTAGSLVGTGSNTTQLSATAMSATLAGAGSQGQLRIIGLSPYVDNAWGDAFTIARVQIARHQYVSNKVAI